MDTNDFFSGLVKLESSGTMIRITKPRTDAEKIAHEWGCEEIGSVLIFDLPDGADEAEATQYAAAVAAVDLRAFGILDRHLQVEAGHWRGDGESIEVPMRMRVEVIKGIKRAPRTIASKPKAVRKPRQSARDHIVSITETATYEMEQQAA